MPNLAAVLKDEIRRLARREANALMSSHKKASAQYRRDIAALKRQIAEQQKRIAYLEGCEGKRVGVSAEPGAAQNVRFSPAWVKKHREKLGLSAADYAALVGVSPLTVYNWEKGKTKPQAKQLAAWGAIRGLGKREAWRRLELME